MEPQASSHVNILWNSIDCDTMRVDLNHLCRTQIDLRSPESSIVEGSFVNCTCSVFKVASSFRCESYHSVIPDGTPGSLSTITCPHIEVARSHVRSALNCETESLSEQPNFVKWIRWNLQRNENDVVLVLQRTKDENSVRQIFRFFVCVDRITCEIDNTKGWYAFVTVLIAKTADGSENTWISCSNIECSSRCKRKGSKIKRTVEGGNKKVPIDYCVHIQRMWQHAERLRIFPNATWTAVQVVPVLRAMFNIDEGRAPLATGHCDTEALRCGYGPECR
jgi:hypothetical protein